MLTEKPIAERLSEARGDADLGIIYDIWPEQDRSNHVMRPSDHLAIRKSAAALERVGSALARQLASDRVAEYRTLPEITPTTRVRKTPRRLWLEINLNEPRGEWAARTVLFAEFSKKGVRFGIRFPTDGAPLGKLTSKALRQYVSSDPLNMTGWQLERRTPPAEQQACSNDLNTWLEGRRMAQHRDTVSLVLNKTSSGNRPLMKTLVEEMSEALILMGEVLDLDTKPPGFMPAGQKVPCLAMI